MATRTFEFEGLRAVVEDVGFHPELGQYVFDVRVEAPTGEFHRGHIITGGEIRKGPPGTVGRPWKEDYAYAALQALGLMRALLDVGVEDFFRKQVRNYGIYDKEKQAKTRAKIEDSWAVSQIIGPQALDMALTELEPMAKKPPGYVKHALEVERSLEPAPPLHFQREKIEWGYDLPLPPGMEKIKEAVLKVKAGEMTWERFRQILRREIVYMDFVHPSQIDVTVDGIMAQVMGAVEQIEEEGSEMSGAVPFGLEHLPIWEEFDLFMV